MDIKEIEKRFTTVVVTNQGKISLDDMKVRLLELAHAINALMPDGREKSLALTALEETMHWADAGIARSNDANSNKALERSE